MSVAAFATAVLACVASLAVAQTPTWETVYSASSAKPWLVSVWLDGDGSWIAGGIDRIVVGRRDGTETIGIPGYEAYAFRRDQSGRLFAVGSRQAVWEITAGKATLVHGRAGAPLKGRAAYGEILIAMDHIDPEHPKRLVAYGPSDLVVWHDPGTEGWVTATDRRLADRGNEGPDSLPAGCHAAGWWWLDGDAGVRTCHEGTAYLQIRAVTTPLGRLPAACQMTLDAAARDGDRVFIACGAKGKAWEHGLGRDGWTEIPGISKVRSLHARGGCILAGTERAVHRRCVRSAPRRTTSP